MRARENRRSSNPQWTHASFFEFTRRFSFDPSDASTRIRLIIATVALAWVPIPALALLVWPWTGELDPVLGRAEVHARPLCSLALVLLADALLEQRVDRTLASLVDDGVLAPQQEAALAQIRRRQLRAVGRFDLGLVAAIALTLTAAGFGLLPAWTLRWLTSTAQAHSPAWWWYIVIAQPILLLGLGRWLFRWLQWTAQVWRLARLRPAAYAAHFDGVGGLGFLRLPIDALRMFVLALGVAIAARWFDEIVAGQAAASTFSTDVMVFLIAVVSLLHLPYVAFVPLLARARIAAELAYTSLMRRFLVAFERTWLAARRDFDDDPALLASPDFSGLADIGAGAAAVERMRSTIPTRSDLVALLFVAALPFAVLGLVFGESTTDLLRKLVRSLVGA